MSDELRERVARLLCEAAGVPLTNGPPPDDDWPIVDDLWRDYLSDADAAIRIVAEHCAEITVSYDWLGERRAAGIGRFGSGVDEGLFAEGADHAAAEIARNIRALIPEEPTDEPQQRDT